MTARALMIQGGSSHAGKSLLAAALCRIYARKGLRVAPFKSQNMSNNAAVCPGGAEIGRAQALQAEACRIPPSADMNPVLLKPSGRAGCQVVLMGKAIGYRRALAYENLKARLWPEVTAALSRLQKDHDLIVVEGAGSPAEINLRAREIVNMRVARHLRCPVLLVVDIDRGGAFASVVGTLALLTPTERKLVKGWILNKFRGDARLLDSGIREVERRTGKPCLGVIPFLPEHGLDEEDSLGLEGRKAKDSVWIAVVRFPHIANYTDLQALERDGVGVRYVCSPGETAGARALILPGTKHTLADMAWMRKRGLDRAVACFKGTVIGICGGFQMLGEKLEDPEGSDGGGRPGRARGLGLLPTRTLFLKRKATRLVSAECLLSFAKGTRLQGYEIHMGETRGGRPAFRTSRPDGAVRGRVWGTYLHGLFDAPGFRRAFLRSLGIKPSPRQGKGADPLDRWADHVERHLDLSCIDRLVGRRPGKG